MSEAQQINLSNSLSATAPIIAQMSYLHSLMKILRSTKIPLTVMTKKEAQV
jgi:hypothetical protein